MWLATTPRTPGLCRHRGHSETVPSAGGWDVEIDVPPTRRTRSGPSADAVGQGPPPEERDNSVVGPPMTPTNVLGVPMSERGPQRKAWRPRADLCPDVSAHLSASGPLVVGDGRRAGRPFSGQLRRTRTASVHERRLASASLLGWVSRKSSPRQVSPHRWCTGSVWELSASPR